MAPEVEGWGSRIVERMSVDLKAAFSGHEGMVSFKPHVHAAIRRGRAAR